MSAFLNVLLIILCRVFTNNPTMIKSKPSSDYWSNHCSYQRSST